MGPAFIRSKRTAIVGSRGQMDVQPGSKQRMSVDLIDLDETCDVCAVFAKLPLCC